MHLRHLLIINIKNDAFSSPIFSKQSILLLQNNNKQIQANSISSPKLPFRIILRVFKSHLHLLSLHPAPTCTTHSLVLKRVAQFFFPEDHYNLVFLTLASANQNQLLPILSCSSAQNFYMVEELVVLSQFQMISAEKKIWSQEEDQLLRKLYEEEGMRNWSMIAKRMSSEHGLPRKSAKQCRERYENHINTETAKVEWTIDEELLLIQYHNDIGNKWSVIAQKIPGKSDNCIKNHFYSKLRKVLRKLNAVIHAYFRREFREININVIYKIVEACEELFKEKPNCDQVVSLTCREIQNKMLNLSMLNEEQFDSEERVAIYREVVRQIYAVSKLYKRKSKKSRNSSIQAPNIKLKRKKEVIVLNANPNIEQGYQSESSSAFDDPEQPDSSARRPHPRSQHEESPRYRVAVAKPKPNDVVVKDEEQGIKDLLKDAGLLQFDQSDVHSMNGFKFSSKSSFKSYSEKNDEDQQFFEDSQLEKGFYTKTRKGSCFRFVDNPSERSEGEGEREQFFNS